MITIDV